MQGPHEHERYIHYIKGGGMRVHANGSRDTNPAKIQWICIHCGEIYHEVEVKEN